MLPAHPSFFPLNKLGAVGYRDGIFSLVTKEAGPLALLAAGHRCFALGWDRCLVPDTAQVVKSLALGPGDPQSQALHNRAPHISHIRHAASTHSSRHKPPLSSKAEGLLHARQVQKPHPQQVHTQRGEKHTRNKNMRYEKYCVCACVYVYVCVYVCTY